MDKKVYKKDWGVEIAKEREFWIKNLINTFINIPNKCKYYNKGNINLRNNNIINPFLADCNN